MMQSQNYTSTFTVDQTPDEVFGAINNVRGWWTGEIQGDTDVVGAEFSYRYPGFHYSKQQIADLVPGKTVVWKVVESHLDGPDDPSEWTGTTITFEIMAKDSGTEVRFSHLGLVPEFECYDSCSSGWSFYTNASLRRLIATGEGPTPPPWA